MQLSVFFDHIKAAAGEMGISPEEMLRHYAKQGIDAVEIEIGMNFDAVAFAAMCADTGVSACPFAFFDFARVDGYDEERIANCLAAAITLHAKQFLCVPGLFSADENIPLESVRIVESIRRMSDLFEQNGIQLMVENFDHVLAPTQTMAGLDALLSGIPSLGFALDTGNFLCGDLTAMTAAKRYQSRICRVHLKDRKRSDDESAHYVMTPDGEKRYCCAVGSGFLPIRETISFLLGGGFQGTCVIELYDVVPMKPAMDRSLAFFAHIS